MTTCGLSTAGSGSEDEGEQLPLHGIIGNTPCEHIYWTEDADNIYIHAQISEEQIFRSKLHLTRVIRCSKWENTFTITDTVENRGDASAPVMLLYHMRKKRSLQRKRHMFILIAAEVFSIVVEMKRTIRKFYRYT